MGSGCNSNGTNRGPNITPDRNVKYTGPAIPSLGICTGDFLDEITAVIVHKLVDYASGIGITLPDVDITQCAFLDDFIECCLIDKSLTALINNILKSLCTIDGRFTSINAVITNIQNSLNYTLVPGCITVPANSKIDTLLNRFIVQYCAFVSKVTNIFGDLDNPVLSETVINQITDTVLNTVLNSISGCAPADVIKSGTGIHTTLQIRGVAPIGSYLFGDWPISYFDTDGLGKAEYGLCGWAIANGNAYAPDVRGFGLAMANNIPGPVSLSNIVDPTFNGDADFATNIGNIKGSYKVKLTATQSGLPPHGHGVLQTPHTHTNGAFDRLLKHTGTKTLGQNDDNDSNGREPVLDDSMPMLAANANITIQAAAAVGAEQAHDNRQPTLYINCIKRVS